METPADTRTMGIVHSALRRDLARLRVVLAETPYPQARQRRAVADHVTWMMHFLHRHHGGEDAGLWPAVRARNPAAAGLLDIMDADHRAIEPRIAELEAAAARYRDDEQARASVLEAVVALEDALLPHLRREELEMMPVVSATLSAAEWDAIEQEFMVGPKSKGELAAEGQWIIDNQDEESRELILGVVPPVLRFVLLHGYGPVHRRRRRAVWGDSAAVDVPALRADAPDPTRSGGRS